MAQTTPYGIGMVQANDPTFADTSQSNVTVCIIDSGYQRRTRTCRTTTCTGTNDTGTGNWNEDSCGHGTHVAGTDRRPEQRRGRRRRQRQRRCSNLHIEKVFDGADCGWTYSSSLVTALNRCRTDGLEHGPASWS